MNDDTIIAFGVLFAALCFGTAGAWIGYRKRVAEMGFWLSFFFGPLGLLVTALALDRRPQCPSCKSRLENGAAICPACRTPVPPGFYRDPSGE